MDTVTQGLLGAAAAQAFFGRRLGRGVAAIGALAGALPDVDIFFHHLADHPFPFTYHRHFTHAILFIPFGALLSTLPFIPFQKFREDPVGTYSAAFVAFATHGLLDCCTSFGTHWLWPLLETRVAWDILPIVDPIFSGVLLLGVLFAFFRHSKTPVWIALFFCLVYTGFGYYQRTRAEEAQATIARSRGHKIEKSRTIPMPLSLFMWRSIYRSQSMIYADQIRIPIGDDPGYQEVGRVPHFSLARLRRQPTTPGVEKLFHEFMEFTDDFMGPVPDVPSLIGDLRVTRSGGFDTLWGIEITGHQAYPVVWRFVKRDVTSKLVRNYVDAIVDGDDFVELPK